MSSVDFTDHYEAKEGEASAAHALRRLQAITDVALSHLSFESLERDLLDRIRHLLSGDVAMLLLLTPDEKNLLVSATSDTIRGFEDRSARHILIPVGRGVAGRIASERKPIIFDDLTRVNVINPLFQEMNIRSLIGAPMMMKGQMIGVVHVGTVRLHAFSNDDAALLQLVADRFAIAVDRARLYDAAHEAEQRKSAILEAALDCIIIMDHQGLITEFNPAAEHTFGYSRSQAIGKLLADLIIPPALRDAHTHGLARYLESGEGAVLNRRIEIMGMRSDGAEFPVELTVIPLHVHGKPLFTGYLRDITERKNAEEERERLLAEAQMARADAVKANRAKDEFLAMVSHELRTPLTPLLGWAEMLVSKKLNESDSEDALKAILHSAKIQLRLVEDLLDVSHIITHKLELQIIPIELELIVLQAISIIRPAAQEKRIHLRTFLDHTVGVVPVDPMRLQQIITNLVLNAIKFTPSGGSIDVRLTRIGSYAQIEVIDTGCGISAEFLRYVFDRLYQADSSSTRKHSGLGLGLSIVRHLVELHEGKVWADSAGIDQGATFTVQLPLSKPVPPIQ